MAPIFQLAIERHIAIAPARLWRAWTEHLAEWWCPRPWRTEIDALELWPGGAFRGTMRGPDGASEAMDGVFLEITPARIVFSDAFGAGWVPKKPHMVAIFSFADDGAGGTHYRAAARHWDEKAMHDHAAMGFAAGWSAVTDQLAAVAAGLE